jgi:hypothetical protein
MRKDAKRLVAGIGMPVRPLESSKPAAPDWRPAWDSRKALEAISAWGNTHCSRAVPGQAAAGQFAHE